MYSRDRLSSETLEEMEARLMSRAARMLIARALNSLPRVCTCAASERRGGTYLGVACAQAVAAACVAVRWSMVGTASKYSRMITALVSRANGGISDHVTKPWEPSRS